MNLQNAMEGKDYRIERIASGDEEMDAFLLSLGCMQGERITVVSHLRGGCVAAIRDGRYTLDRELAQAIHIC